MGLELVGGLLGTAVAVGGAAAVLSASRPAGRSCLNDDFCDEGANAEALGSVIVTGLAYLLFAPFSIGGGVAGAGAIKGRGMHFEFATGGAVLGMATAVGIALAASEAGAGDDTTLGLFVGVGLIAPVLTSMLFYELSPKPDNAKRIAASWQPYVSATADGSGGALGVAGVF